MTLILFLTAILFAIPTSGLSLLAFAIYLLARSYLTAKVRVYEVDRRAAERAVDSEPGLPSLNKDAPNRPSWYDTQMEKTFFEGVSKIATRKGVPLVYVVNGFAHPDSASVLFRFAAVMENRGRSFSEQQMGVAEFIVGSWSDLGAEDQDALLVTTKDRASALNRSR